MTSEEIIKFNYDNAVKGIDEILLLNKDNWYTYINDLSDHLKITYTIVVLHEQVFNGGFHQYFFNSYGQFAYLTLSSLEEIKASKTKLLLEKVLNEVNREKYDLDEFRSRVYNRKLERIVNFDGSLGDFLDKCDDEYYDLDEDLNELLGKYLESSTN